MSPLHVHSRFVTSKILETGAQHHVKSAQNSNPNSNSAETARLKTEVNATKLLESTTFEADSPSNRSHCAFSQHFPLVGSDPFI